MEPTLELIFQRVHPDDRDLVQQALTQATNDKSDFDCEHRLLMPDGSVKNLHVIGRASSTSPDHIEFVGAVTDITAAKQAEDKIRQSELELRQIMDFAPSSSQYLGMIAAVFMSTRLPSTITALHSTSGENVRLINSCILMTSSDFRGKSK